VVSLFLHARGLSLRLRSAAGCHNFSHSRTLRQCDAAKGFVLAFAATHTETLFTFVLGCSPSRPPPGSTSSSSPQDSVAKSANPLR
jgi:hypothetical protein